MFSYLGKSVYLMLFPEKKLKICDVRFPKFQEFFLIVKRTFANALRVPVSKFLFFFR